MPLGSGVPRKTLFLCPGCNREAINAVISGHADVEYFRNSAGVVEAEIIDEAGRILMRKARDEHGPFEGVLSNDPPFFKTWKLLRSVGIFGAYATILSTITVSTASGQGEGHCSSSI